MKTIEHLKSMSIDLTNPVMKLKDIDFNMINLFTGQNGIGKTFLLKNSFCLNSIANIAVLTKGKKSEVLSGSQYVYDKSMVNQDFTGKISCAFTSGATVDIEFETGKVKDCIVAGIEGIDTPVPVRYLSSQMRTFSAISSYLKMRKVVAPMLTQEKIMERMLDEYPLYDVQIVESMILRCPIKVDERIKESFDKFDITDDIVEFGVDLEKCDFYTVSSKDEKKFLSSQYGSGHQALFNMILNTHV